MVKISPSVLAADLSRLADEVSDIERAGADMVHLDVMDGAFVTNISFGLPVIECLRKHTDMIFDVHIMIADPEAYAERFIDAGADILTFHYEASKDPLALLKTIRAKGAKASVSIKPATDVEVLYDLLPFCDMVLVMTVEPGYGGQKFMPDMLQKVRKLRAEAERRGLDIDIQVDGGINADNAPDAVAAGANVLVAGSSVFKFDDRRAAIDALR